MKKTLCVLSAAALATTLVGCKSDSIITKDAGEQLQVYTLDQLKGREVKIELWHSFGDTITKSLNPLIKEFEETYKGQGYNISVKVESISGGYDGLRQRVVQGIPSNALPSLLLGYPDHFADYLKGNVLLPLTDFVNSTNPGVGLSQADQDDFIDSYWNENTQFDSAKNIYGLPFNKSTEVFTYNATLIDPILKELGYVENEGDLWTDPTWDEVFAVAEKVKGSLKTPSNSQNKAYPVMYDSTSNFFITVARQWGGKYTERVNQDNIESGKILFDNAEVKEGLAYFQSKANNDLFQLPGKVGQKYSSTFFINQETAMVIGSSAGIKNNASDSFVVKSTSLTQKSQEKNRAVIQQGTNLAILSKSTDNYQRLAAFELIKFLTSASIQEKFSIQTGYLPVRNSVFESETYKAFLNEEGNMVAGAIKAGKSQTEYLYTDTAFVGSSTVRRQVGLVVEDVFLSNKSIDEAIATAYEALPNFN